MLLSLLLPIGSIAAGLVALIAGAHWLVRGATSLARHWRWSPLVIGLSVVAMGTSAPELVVSVLASFAHNGSLAIGNIIGSNIANTLLIIGLAGLIAPLTLHRATIWKEIPVGLTVTAILAVLLNDWWSNATTGTLILDRHEGLLLIILFILYTYRLASANNKEKALPQIDDVLRKSHARLQAVIGIIVLGLGGHLTVFGASAMATSFGISSAFIGLTIVAIGTSLPEIATSIVAMYKNQPDIAIGNAIGSNIFNILLIAGVSALVHPLEVSSGYNVDLTILGIATLLILAFMFIGKKHTLERSQAAFLILCYICYIISLSLRHF